MIKTRTAGQVGVGALALGLVLAALMSVMLAASKPAHAANTFTVSSILDLPDLNVGDGVCDVITSGGNQCGLRAAIQEANHPNSPGADVINFNINSGGGVATIRPGSALPIITEAVTIDGYTQPGSSVNTLAKGTNAVLMIQLDGTGTVGNGLEIVADGVVVRGLAVGNFRFSGIEIDDGTDGLGDPSGVRIEGNFIGTDASGTQVRGNQSNGLNLVESGGNNTIGGTSPLQRNLISANSNGITFTAGNGDFAVEGNLIGTKKDGTSALGNDNNGVDISGSSSNLIGGSSPTAANTIAFNGGDGVNVVGDNSTSNRILSNSIFSNDRLGIDLVGGTENETGATKNDPGDTDTGANDLQNKPKIKSATTSGGTTTIKGKLNSTSRDPFVIQFFSNPPGTDEGKKFLGDKSVSTGPDGSVTFTFELNQKVDAGANITATATNVVEANTSEFSGPRAVVAQ